MPTEESARERFFKHFQSSAARDELKSEDLGQFARADDLERSGKIKLPFKKVNLVGDYKSPVGFESDMGRCLRRSLREAIDIDVENLPDVVDPKDLPAISAELGLTFHTGPKKITLPKGKDVIVLYETGKDSAHAIVTNNVAKFSEKGKKIVAILEIPNKS